jgi:MSHA biogenesis protein MshK
MRLNLLLIAAALCLASGSRVSAESDLSVLPDPTRPAGVSDVESIRNRGLTEIRITPHNRSAVIDGRTVRIGDTVNGAVVSDIRPDEVVLKRGEQLSTMRLMPQLKTIPDKGAAGK